MWLRRAFFRWMIPAAFVLPLWLLIGWSIFSASGWAFLGTLFIAIPAVFVGQLVVTLLIRSRPDVRETRAVSWWDVAAMTAWHALLIVFGCYPEGIFFAVFALTIVAFLALFWSSLAQLWAQAKAKIDAYTVVPPAAAGPRAPQPEVIVLREVREETVAAPEPRPHRTTDAD